MVAVALEVMVEVVVLITVKDVMVFLGGSDVGSSGGDSRMESYVGGIGMVTAEVGVEEHGEESGKGIGGGGLRGRDGDFRKGTVNKW